VNVVLDVFAVFLPVTRPAHRERGLKAAWIAHPYSIGDRAIVHASVLR
jgi:hypothetical protein